MTGNDDLQQRWWNLEAKLAERFGKKPDMEAILFPDWCSGTGAKSGQIHQEQKQGPDAYSYLYAHLPAVIMKWKKWIRRIIMHFSEPSKWTARYDRHGTGKFYQRDHILLYFDQIIYGIYEKCIAPFIFLLSSYGCSFTASCHTKKETGPKRCLLHTSKVIW